MSNTPVENTRPWGAKPLAQQYEAEPRAETTLTHLVQYILERHHAYLKVELPRLDSLLAKLSAIPCNRHGAMLHRLRRLFEDFKLDLEIHMHKEETVLFPAILQLERAVQAGSAQQAGSLGSFSNVIRMMALEHDGAEADIDRMRDLTHNYRDLDDAGEALRSLIDGLRSLDADLRFHIHLEDDVLFKRAIQLASAGGT